MSKLEEKPKDGKAQTAESEKKRILIVDDEEDICETLSQYLSVRGLATGIARNGKEAVEALKDVKPDLIILDVKMPKMGGFEFLKYLKARPKYSKIPVIMLTIKSERPYLDKGLTLGADFYLPKPFSLTNLMNFIRVTLEACA